ncbi:MAG: gas vesicle protein [Ilumatobacter sp.]|nr:gas vesicle protein [Ilumatobacter sp.]
MYPTATDTTSPLAYRGQKSSLAELFEVILDRGLVIDAFVRVSLIGIELLTVDARVVIASVDTYLHFAEAVNRLDLRESSNAWSISDLGGMGGDMVDDAMDSLQERVGDAVPFVDADGEQQESKSSSKSD